MGPVNLRAEVEAEEIGKQIDTIARERDELTEAIAKLRGSIGNLNREGRERLSAVFEQVDKQFPSVVRAACSAAGARTWRWSAPTIRWWPGWRSTRSRRARSWRRLSLLSGGEQALTALVADLRRVPLQPRARSACSTRSTRRSTTPMCSVSATLLDDMARETATRFLVVTHHPLTMARMDRLYGVTMQERGVSRLLSVDLQRAAEMAEQPTMAAE